MENSTLLRGLKIVLIVLLCFPTLTLAKKKIIKDHDKELKEKVLPSYVERMRMKKPPDVPVGLVEKILGLCYFYSDRTESEEDAVVGGRLYSGDNFKTKKCRVHARYKDGVFLEVGEKTSVKAYRVPDHAQRMRIAYRFYHGVTRFVTKPVTPDDFIIIRTSNALIKLIGSAEVFVIQLKKRRDLTVRLIYGKAELKNLITHETKEIEGRAGATVRVTGLVNKATKISTKEYDFLKAQTMIIPKRKKLPGVEDPKKKDGEDIKDKKEEIDQKLDEPTKTSRLHQEKPRIDYI